VQNVPLENHETIDEVIARHDAQKLKNALSLGGITIAILNSLAVNRKFREVSLLIGRSLFMKSFRIWVQETII